MHILWLLYLLYMIRTHEGMLLCVCQARMVVVNHAEHVAAIARDFERRALVAEGGVRNLTQSLKEVQMTQILKATEIEHIPCARIVLPPRCKQSSSIESSAAVLKRSTSLDSFGTVVSD